MAYLFITNMSLLECWYAYMQCIFEIFCVNIFLCIIRVYHHVPLVMFRLYVLYNFHINSTLKKQNETMLEMLVQTNLRNCTLRICVTSQVATVFSVPPKLLCFVHKKTSQVVRCARPGCKTQGAMLKYSYMLKHRKCIDQLEVRLISLFA